MDPTPFVPTPSVPIPSLDGVTGAVNTGTQTVDTVSGWLTNLGPVLTSDSGRLKFAICIAIIVGVMAAGARLWAMPFAALGGFWIGWGVYNQFWAADPQALFPGPGSLGDMFSHALESPGWPLVITLFAILAAVLVFVGSRQRPSGAKNPAVKAAHGVKWLIRLGLRIVAAVGTFAGVLLIAALINSIVAVITSS